MVKYNYKKAGQLFNIFFNITADMPAFYDNEMRQKERRQFMHDLTRGADMSEYLDEIAGFLISFGENVDPSERIELEKVALQIVLFTN
jgi:hypothetical protein